jgi:hypothetical protein
MTTSTDGIPESGVVSVRLLEAIPSGTFCDVPQMMQISLQALNAIYLQKRGFHAHRAVDFR